MASKYDIETIRQQVKKKTGGFERDPDEFRPPKAGDGKELHYRFFILPPFTKGDKLVNGPASQSMDNVFFVEDGQHFIDNRPYGCPRVIEKEQCPLCDYGFKLMADVKEEPALTDDQKKEQSSKIRRDLVASGYKKINIYFPTGKLGEKNPEELRGRVMWMNASHQVFTPMWECLSRDDDGGDELDRKPFGVFFDEEEAYLFDLKITKNFSYNSYEGSKFVTTDTIKKIPIVYGPGLKPDHEGIQAVLARRHDLFSKLAKIDGPALERIVSNLSGNGGGKSSGGAGFNYDEETVAKEPTSVAGEMPAKATTKATTTKTTTTKATTTKAAPTATKVTKAVEESVVDPLDEMNLDESSDSADDSNETVAVEAGGVWEDDIDSLLNQLD